uniref:USP domain-containing protein n=1 Tax=Macrostomum lignano TaxID=282301 RepID=A0A1I8ITY3_9PLAT
MNSSTSTVIIGPDDVFVRCKLQLTELPGLASAAAAIRLFCRVTDGDSPLRKHLSVYKRCLRSVRASFRLSTSDSLKSDGGICHFRGLTLDAAMSRCSVLRLTNPANDFDLNQPMKRVLLRPCGSCGAENQRVLISWESSPPALLVESPEGVPSAAAAAAGSKPSCGLLHSTSLSTAPGVEYLPTAMIEQRRRSKPVAEDGADCFDYIAWLFNSDSERWMAMSSESRFASYAEDATPPTTTTNSKILCILYERQPGPVAAAALPDSESDVESVDQNEVDIRNNNNNKSELETSDRSSEPAPTNFNDKTETASISSTAGRSVLSLRHRLESVMQSRRQNPTSSKLLPPGLGSVDDSYVMSRFLDVVATTAAAAASPSDVSFSSRRHSRRHRLRGYLEDNRQRRGVGVGAATSPAAASVAYDEASTKTGSDQASEFDVLNLFL